MSSFHVFTFNQKIYQMSRIIDRFDETSRSLIQTEEATKVMKIFSEAHRLGDLPDSMVSLNGTYETAKVTLGKFEYIIRLSSEN